MTPFEGPSRGPLRIPFWFGACALLAIAAFFLWTEHRAHLLGALPYLLLALCPFMHFFMHRGHSGHDGHAAQAGSAEHSDHAKHAQGGTR